MAKTYDVDVSAHVWTTITVEADNEEEAMSKALDEFDVGDCEIIEKDADNVYIVNDDDDEDDDEDEDDLCDEDDEDDYLYDEEDEE